MWSYLNVKRIISIKTYIFISIVNIYTHICTQLYECVKKKRQSTLSDLRSCDFIVIRVNRESRTKDYNKRQFSLVLRNLFTDQDPNSVLYILYTNLMEYPRLPFVHVFWFCLFVFMSVTILTQFLCVFCVLGWFYRGLPFSILWNFLFYHNLWLIFGVEFFI